MKIRKLKSGAWNARITVDGKTYSFTDKDKKAVRRMAAAFQFPFQDDSPNMADATSQTA